MSTNDVVFERPLSKRAVLGLATSVVLWPLGLVLCVSALGATGPGLGGKSGRGLAVAGLVVSLVYLQVFLLALLLTGAGLAGVGALLAGLSPDDASVSGQSVQDQDPLSLLLDQDLDEDEGEATPSWSAAVLTGGDGVELDACESDEATTIVSGTVTNPTEDELTYVVTIAAVSSDAATFEITSEPAVVAPGQSADFFGVGPGAPTTLGSCVVTGVDAS